LAAAAVLLASPSLTAGAEGPGENNRAILLKRYSNPENNNHNIFVSKATIAKRREQMLIKK
jgi:hypothetical protein